MRKMVILTLVQQHHWADRLQSKHKHVAYLGLFLLKARIWGVPIFWLFKIILNMRVTKLNT